MNTLGSESGAGVVVVEVVLVVGLPVVVEPVGAKWLKVMVELGGDPGAPVVVLVVVVVVVEVGPGVVVEVVLVEVVLVEVEVVLVEVVPVVVDPPPYCAREDCK